MIKNGRKVLKPEDVGHVIAKALTVARPEPRYTAVKGKLSIGVEIFDPLSASNIGSGALLVLIGAFLTRAGPFERVGDRPCRGRTSDV